MGLLDKIKEDAKKSGSSKGKFIFFKQGEKRRIRFLNDMEEGMEISFHDNYETGINVPCQEIFDRECIYCNEEGLRTRSQYLWSVWDYENKEVKLFMYPMNNCSPLGAIAAMYENYGTLLDRDYVISVTGERQNKTFSVVPMDKEKLRNPKAKPFSKKAVLDILDKAYPDENSEKYGSGEKSKKERDKKEGFMNSPDVDYSEMSAKELYKLCEEREIEAEPKMKPQYYIELLEEADENLVDEVDEWDNEDDEEKDYSQLSAKELYEMCMERDIECEKKKPTKYYINLLKEDDKAHDDWDDEDEYEDW